MPCFFVLLAELCWRRAAVAKLTVDGIIVRALTRKCDVALSEVSALVNIENKFFISHAFIQNAPRYTQAIFKYNVLSQANATDQDLHQFLKWKMNVKIEITVPSLNAAVASFRAVVMSWPFYILMISLILALMFASIPLYKYLVKRSKSAAESGNDVEQLGQQLFSKRDDAKQRESTDSSEESEQYEDDGEEVADSLLRKQDSQLVRKDTNSAEAVQSPRMRIVKVAKHYSDLDQAIRSDEDSSGTRKPVKSRPDA